MMTKDPAQIAEPAGVKGTTPGKLPLTQRLKARAIDETTRFVVMFLYLWVVFGVFALQQSVVLAQRNIDEYVQFGFAFINALIFAKVMLVAEDFNLGHRFRDRPLIVPIFYKSFVFSLVFLCFHIVEKIVIGKFEGKGMMESLPMIGGNFIISLSAVLIFTFELMPYFAYREVGRIIGEEKMYSLVFARRSAHEQRKLGN